MSALPSDCGWNVRSSCRLKSTRLDLLLAHSSGLEAVVLEDDLEPRTPHVPVITIDRRHSDRVIPTMGLRGESRMR